MPPKPPTASAESLRLQQDANREKNWKRWGPYLSERQWGTVREDYSPTGEAWGYFSHDHARSRAYRWGEDGLLGITDRECRVCFALALWNGRDPILKERLYGLTGPEGNHGEDVKECYYYLDSTPTHSYMRALYKYPQAEFPYGLLLEANRRRGRDRDEAELEDTGVLDDGRYFDIEAEYAKAGPNDILIRITATNRGPERAELHLLPTLWCRNSWSWGCTHEGCEVKPRMREPAPGVVALDHASLRKMFLHAEARAGGEAPRLLFTENESNAQRLWGAASPSPYVKDAFHRWLIGGESDAVNPKRIGTKVAAHYPLDLAAGERVQLHLRLFTEGEAPQVVFGKEFDRILADRKREADEFFDGLPGRAPGEGGNVQRQCYAGLLWSKQFYHYSVHDWLDGDPDNPKPPDSRLDGRNSEWRHLFNRDIISMPDKWEYPWYAAWDLAFHMIPFARLDPHFAKEQLVLLLREWYMHPNGQIPAYEWAFGDVNPPVHAWAAWRIYKMTGKRGSRDRLFLERVFHKLMLNFTWWVNRKDPSGKNIFSGGFLGLDNIGVFDRSKPLPTGGHLEQADGTAWMAFYCGTMLSIALELASEDIAYEDVASKFFEHFVSIADAMNTMGGSGLWDEEDGFYYDKLNIEGRTFPIKVRSMVGIIPLFATLVLEDDVLDRLPGFRRRMQWFLDHRRDLAKHIAYMDCREGESRGGHQLAIPSMTRLERVLKIVLDEEEFLSPFGIRSLSRRHAAQPYTLRVGTEEYRVDYEPAESRTGLFGGNSNWRGPIWFPVNYLLIEALERYHFFYRDTLKVECPTGSGKWMNLKEVAAELTHRMVRLFMPDKQGDRPCHGEPGGRYATDPHWKDLVLFHEYFHGETGKGLGASHQTGWTALVARMIEDYEA